MSIKNSSAVLVLCLSLSLPWSGWAEPSPHGDEFTGKPVPEEIEFNRDVRPILSGKCFHCHGQDPESRKARLRLDSFAEATKDKNGLRAVVPGDLENSELVWRILSEDTEEIMPPPSANHPLSPREIEILKRWIKQGAEYGEHWAFIPPSTEIAPPDPRQHPIDAFIRKRLGEAGLSPATRADPHTLVRRVALDLTGLPPNPEEVRRFAVEGSEESYGEMVDHFLAKPAFGEHWAVMWLDLARYADSSGYGSDPLRPNLWPWRDWVIRAFNENKPFDQFSIEQIAGDLLTEPTMDQLIATAFHRNTMTNTEGGTDDEEFRVAAVKDRVATTFQGWMGLTVGCAQCHTHKFDPITHDEYYGLFAIFNQTADSDRQDEEPTLALPTPEEAARRERILAEIAAHEADVRQGNDDAIRHELVAMREQLLRTVPWSPAPIARIHTSLSSTPRVMPDGSALLTTTPRPATAVYAHEITAIKGSVTALQLEALPDPSLPNGGPGLSATGNAVVTHVRVALRYGPTRTIPARFLRIVGKGASDLALEVEAIDGSGANVAAGLRGTGTGAGEAWELDLGRESRLSGVKLRPGSAGIPDLAGLRLQLLDAQRQNVGERDLGPSVLENDAVLVAERFTLNVRIAHATADFEQPGFPAAAAIDPLPESGWAFGGQEGRAHRLVLSFAAPVRIEEGDRLEVGLSFEHGIFQTLGHYRFAVTDAVAPVFEVPEAVAAALSETTEPGADAERVLIDYFRPLAQATAAARAALAAKQRELNAVRPLRLPVMTDLSREEARKSFLFAKGSYLSPEREVAPGLLQSFGPIPASSPTRLDAARWLFAPTNPLTARVAVNRFWAQLFGRGLVVTQEDFGTQGALPTHPDLLDWLAVHFSRDLRWDMRALLRTIVMSETYRQSSLAAAEANQKDPNNELLSHYPRRRLTAEQVRDQALFHSGLLSKKIGGPSVFPPQPDGLWKAAFNNWERTWETSQGEDRYRRALYTFWRRTVPYPSLITFDAPSRETATFRRVPTNTPLQAFVTLNDPAFVEIAGALGLRLVTEGGPTPEARMRFGLSLVLSRPATEAQVAPLLDLYRDQLADFAADEAAAAELQQRTGAALPAGMTLAEAATWTVVANVLLNLDGVLTIN